MKVRLRKALHMAVATAMMFGVFAGPVHAGTSGEVDAVFHVDSAGPQMLGLELLDMNGFVTRELAPQVPYQLRISLQHDETLNRIQNIKAVFYHSSEGSVPSQGNDTTAAVYEWTKGGAFVKDGTTGQTWTVEQGTNIPDLTKNAGDFTLVFKPGKAARQTGENDRWNVYVRVTDIYGKVAEGTIQDITMFWYGEINVTPDTVDFGTLLHNETHLDAPTPVAIHTISNGNNTLLGRASDTWNGDNGLTVPYDANLQADPSVRVTTRLHDTGQATTLQTADTPIAGRESNFATTEAGLNTVMGLGLDAHGWFERGTYEGKLTFTIAQSLSDDGDSGGGDSGNGGGGSGYPIIPGNYVLLYRTQFDHVDDWQVDPASASGAFQATGESTARIQLPAAGVNSVDIKKFFPAEDLYGHEHILVKYSVRANAYNPWNGKDPYDPKAKYDRFTVGGVDQITVKSTWTERIVDVGNAGCVSASQGQCAITLHAETAGQLDLELDYLEVWVPDR